MNTNTIQSLPRLALALSLLLPLPTRAKPIADLTTLLQVKVDRIREMNRFWLQGPDPCRGYDKYLLGLSIEEIYQLRSRPPRRRLAEFRFLSKIRESCDSEFAAGLYEQILENEAWPSHFREDAVSELGETPQPRTALVRRMKKLLTSPEPQFRYQAMHVAIEKDLSECRAEILSLATDNAWILAGGGCVQMSLPLCTQISIAKEAFPEFDIDPEDCQYSRRIPPPERSPGAAPEKTSWFLGPDPSYSLDPLADDGFGTGYDKDF